MASDTPREGDVLVMAGTRKGSFLFWSDPDRRQWQRAVHHQGLMVHHMLHDPRDNSIYAATNSSFFDAVVQRTPDFGKTWEKPEGRLEYPDESERQVRTVWHLAIKPTGGAGHLYAGVERAGIFVSGDFGGAWESIEGLNGHPHRDQWNPGGGGLILHTILVDPEEPQRIYAAISAGGVYRSDDGGQSWHPKNQGVRSEFLDDEYPEFGQCVHALAMHPARPEVLYQQNHYGVYRSEDRGESWSEITEGLPSEFGFPIAVHSHDPGTIYVVPLVGSDYRVVPEARMAVWRSRDGGSSWESLTRGLPEQAYLTVLREAMAVDDCESCGVYVGTETGQLFFSRDEGENWETLADYLPPVYSVSVGRVT